MLQIYGTALSSPTNKVRYLANYLNIPYEFQSMNLGAGDQRKPEFLKMNPLGKTPAMDDNGFTLGESNAIIRYLADKQKSDIYPHDLKQRAVIDQWMDYASLHVSIATAKIMFNMYYYNYFNVEQDQRSLQDGKYFLSLYLPVLEKQLSQSPFIAGQTLSLADFSLLAALDVIELCDIDFSTYTHLIAWRKKLMNELFYTKCHVSYVEVFNKKFGEPEKI